MFTLASSFK